MMSRKQRLNLALENAKRHLGSLENDLSLTPEIEADNQEVIPARSNLNRLLGKKSTKDTRKAKLLQRVGVSNRPTFDILADHVLGKESRNYSPSLDLKSTGEDVSDIVAQRLRNLRERTLNSLEEEHLNYSDYDNNYIGYDDDGTPVWKSVMHGQRIVDTLTTAEMENEIALAAHHHSVYIPKDFDWPKKLNFEIHNTFKQWVTVIENRRTTQLAEGVVDSTGKGLNPFLIIGEGETGRSHLLHAISQAVLQRHEGHVFLLPAAELEGLDELPEGWQESLIGCRMLAFDDIDIVAENKVSANLVGKMIDYALNLNVHVVMTSKTQPKDWPASRLWDLCRSCIQSVMKLPSAGSLMLFARTKSIAMNVVLDDSQLATLVTHDIIGWRSTKANLEKVANAIGNGEDIVDAHDVSSILSDIPLESRGIHDDIIEERVENIAQRLISNAVDVVYSDHEIGGIELNSELPELSDDYELPEWHIDDLSRSQVDLLERHVKTTLEDLTPEAPSTLELNDRDKHLVAERIRIANQDVVKAADILTDIEINVEDQFKTAEMELGENAVILENLEQKMLSLAQRASTASLEDLIIIADDLRDLEHKLVEIDPEKDPLPEFVEAKLIRKPAKRRKKKQRKSKPIKISSNVTSILDSYEPAGNWDIDDSEVTANDLLESNNLGNSSIKPISEVLEPHPEGNREMSSLIAKPILISGEEE